MHIIYPFLHILNYLAQWVFLFKFLLMAEITAIPLLQYRY